MNSVLDQFHSFNFFDFFLLTLVVLSAIFGLFRGLVRESLGFLSWVASVYLAVAHGGWVEPFLKKWVPNSVCGVASAFLVFLLSLLVLLSLTELLSNAIKGSSLSGINRFLGMLFGALKTCMLLGLGYGFILRGYPEEGKYPAIVRNSLSVCVLKPFSTYLMSFFPASDPQGEKWMDEASQSKHPKEKVKKENPTSPQTENSRAGTEGA